MIPQSIIERINESTNIVDIIKRYVSLRRSGVDYTGCCPFHSEKTASFHVSPSKNVWKCFGCGEGGKGAASFLMRYEKITYPEAIRKLGDITHIPIEERELTDKERIEDQERGAIRICLEYAQERFLENRLNNKYIEMMINRQISADIISKYKIGYSFSYGDSDSLLRKSLSKGFTMDNLERAGLIIRKENKAYDRFFDRIMFPYLSSSGKITGFSGRLTHGDGPKYMNSPETALFHKGREIFGLYQARQAIVKANSVYITEGQFDVLTMVQNGFDNTIAGSGTALTDEQVKIISRMCDNAILVYDGDNAGVKACIKNLRPLVAAGVSVYCVILPEGEDPDSYLRDGIHDHIDHIRSQRMDFIAYMTDKLPSGTEEERSHVLYSVADVIAGMPDLTLASLFLKKLCVWGGVDPSIIAGYIRTKYGRIIPTGISNNKETREFYQAVISMRNLQRRALSARESSAWRDCRNAERIVDRMIEQHKVNII